jgi:hypothetical protein
MVNRSFPVPIHREIERAALAERRASEHAATVGAAALKSESPAKGVRRGFLLIRH